MRRGEGRGYRSEVSSLYLIGPGVLVPGGELQHPDDLVDLGAHLVEGEDPVPHRVLHARPSAGLGRHEDLDG